MATKLLTYAELAEVWGISRDAARKKVEGLRLPRTLGNDGRTRVTIDLEEVTHTPKPARPEPGGRPGGDQSESTPGDREETGGSPSPQVLAFQAQIAALEARGEELRADLERERVERERERTALGTERDRERTERLQERERAERLSGELAAITRELTRIMEEARDRERGLQESINALQTTPWWKRLRGRA